MRLLSLADFFVETTGGRPNKMKMTPYEGLTFMCACGKEHLYQSGIVNALRELPGMRLVLECPYTPNAVTCVKITGLFRIRFESLFGTIVDEEIEASEVVGTMLDVLEKKYRTKTND